MKKLADISSFESLGNVSQGGLGVFNANFLPMIRMAGESKKMDGLIYKEGLLEFDEDQSIAKVELEFDGDKLSKVNVAKVTGGPNSKAAKFEAENKNIQKDDVYKNPKLRDLWDALISGKKIDIPDEKLVS